MSPIPDPAAYERGRAPGFLDALRALPRAFTFIARQPRLWPLAVVPASLVLLLSGVLIWLSFARFGPWLSQSVLPDPETWYATGASAALRWIGAAVAAYVACLLAVMLAPTLSAPALEHLVRARERALGVPDRPPQSLWREIRNGLSAQLLALSVATPCFALLWLLGLLVPLLLPAVVLLEVALVALTVAWNLLDYPLSARGLPARARLGLLRSHAGAVIGFGLCFAALSLVPLMAVVLLPVGVVAATQLAHGMLAGPREGAAR